MSTFRVLTLDRLKADCIDEYSRLHREVPPELEELNRRCGVRQISSFLNGADLAVLIEYDFEIYECHQEILSNSPLRQRWQAKMKTLCEPGFFKQTFEEVYRLQPQSDE